MNVVYRFGEFRLDPGKRALLRGDTPVPLTPKAFDLLATLIQNRNQLLTKEELLDRVWADTFVEEGILKYNISTIRKALGDEAWIETQPRRGYRFSGTVTEEDTAPLPDLEVASVRVADDTEVRVSVEAELEGSRSAWIWVAIGVILAVGATWILASNLSRNSSGGIRTLAVLPFQSISSAGSNRELELGLTDSLIARLGSEGHWLVRPTGAVRVFANSERDPVAAGKSLQVDAVLDGSIQRSGDKIRFTFQLLRVADGKHLWTGKFEDRLTELFALEDRIAGEVARALSSRLVPAPQTGQRQSSNPEVYELYLAGRHHFNEATTPSTRQAIHSLELAIAKDPSFAPAHGMLALAYWQLTQRGGAPSRDVRDKLRASAARAVQLDEANVEGHIALSFARMWLDFDWAGAQVEYRRAWQLNPNEPLVYVAWGIHAIANGRFAETEEAYRKKLEIDPRSLMSIVGMGYPLYYAGKHDEAIQWFRKALEVDPNFAVVYTDLAIVYGLKGQHKEGVEASLKSMSLSGAAPERIAERLDVFRKQGSEGYRRYTLDQMLGRRERGENVSPVAIASSYVALGDNQKALDWLEKAVDEHTFQVLFLKTFPGWKKLGGEKRYVELLRRMNLTK